MPKRKNKKPAEEAREKLAVMEKYLDGVHHRRHVLNIAVVCVTLTIAVLWGFTLYGRLNNFSWSRMPEKQVIDNARAEWQTAEQLAGSKNKAQKIAEETVKTKLAEMFAAAAAASSATTTTSTATSTQNN